MRRTGTSIAGLLVSLLAALSGPPCAVADEPARDILWTETKHHSLGNEEVIIRDFFQDRRDGFFVDVGCAWPIQNSNTYLLEKDLGWRGIGVDGLPDYAEGWRKARPRSTFLNFLVTDHSDDLERFYKVGVWGLSTAEPEVAEKLHIVGEIEVPGITLDDLLERQGVTGIDLVSIDVEGHTKAVLDGFDVVRWKPKLVCVEDEGPLVVPWFRERGYEPIERYRLRDIVNWYFAPRELALAADARDTERGREERRKREQLVAAAPDDSPLLGFLPMYVLDGQRRLARNPRWRSVAKKDDPGTGSPAPGPASAATPDGRPWRSARGTSRVSPPAAPGPTARR